MVLCSRVGAISLYCLSRKLVQNYCLTHSAISCFQCHHFRLQRHRLAPTICAAMLQVFNVRSKWWRNVNYSSTKRLCAVFVSRCCIVLCPFSSLLFLWKLFTDVSITRSVESHYKHNYCAHNFVITLSRGRQRGASSLQRGGGGGAAAGSMHPRTPAWNWWKGKRQPMRLNELDSTRLWWEAPTRGFESHHARCKVIEWQTMNCVVWRKCLVYGYAKR